MCCVLGFRFYIVSDVRCELFVVLCVCVICKMYVLKNSHSYFILFLSGGGGLWGWGSWFTINYQRLDFWNKCGHAFRINVLVRLGTQSVRTSQDMMEPNKKGRTFAFCVLSGKGQMRQMCLLVIVGFVRYLIVEKVYTLNSKINRFGCGW